MKLFINDQKTEEEVVCYSRDGVSMLSPVVLVWTNRESNPDAHRTRSKKGRIVLGAYLKALKRDDVLLRVCPTFSDDAVEKLSAC